jgi:argininosuccinate lyase
VAERLAAGAAVGAPDEDVHTLVERMLYEEVGDVAGTLNTGRSRNDQVATDLRLWCLDAVADVGREVAALGSALVDQATRGIDILLPGYTHGQRAQPVRWAYVLLAHAWPLVRDRSRLREIAARMSELPLGAGALAGSGVPVDREFLRQALGFQRVAGNSLDVTGDRDFVADVLYALAMIGVHLSRLSGELVTYASSEYAFVRLADAYSTGSSLLPQKRNPDVFELARAKSARLIGGMTGMLTLLRGLPAGYSKDLQEDKALLFDAVDTLLATLPAVRGAVETLEPRPDRMAAALDRSLLATDVADALVRGGLPFREAHAVVGRLVRLGEEQGVDVTALPTEALDALHPELAKVLSGLGSWEASVERRSTAGASSREALAVQFAELSRLLA